MSVRSAFHHEPRVRLSEQKTAKLFLERGGCCHLCKRKLSASDDYIVEHMLALENGGTNDWDNLGLTCGWCKPLKDAEDHGIAAKSRHVATKHVVSKSMRQGGFRKAPEGYSTWTRKWKDAE
jgi:5-methylcytosine-specific restriction endonuclease McrA